MTFTITNFKQKNTTLTEKIYKKLYFQIALGLPLLLSISSAILIINDLNLYLCWTKQCLDNFVTIFSLPINLLGLTFISIGASFAYYRIDLNYDQTEKQLEQFTQTNYITFRNDFFESIDLTNMSIKH